MARKIFVLKDKDVSVFNESDYKEIKIMNSKNEVALQKCIEKFPELIPADQINPSNPPIFIVIKSEAGVTPGSIDILLLDNSGVLTIVETKLYQNREIRRTIIGQVIEYASHLIMEWTKEDVRNSANEYWQKMDKNFDVYLCEAFSISSSEIESFWDKVQDNLNKWKIRIIVVADKIPKELHQVIEFINRSSKFEMFALEVKLFSDKEGKKILVPYLIGAIQKKPIPAETNVWTESEFILAMKEHPNHILCKRTLELLELSKQINAFDITVSKRPSFIIRNKDRKHLMTINENGIIYVSLKEDRFEKKEYLENFLDKLNNLSIFNYNKDKDIGHTRNSQGKINDLTDEEFFQFKEIISAAVTGKID